MAVDTFYFDGHTSITDPNTNWTDDANAFDGSASTYATSSSDGTSSSNYLQGIGTNASGITDNITQVRVRLGAYSLLDAGTGYTAYDILDAPSGGWTQTAVQNLETRIWRTGGGTGFANFAVYESGDAGGTSLGGGTISFFSYDSPAIVEVEVTYTESTGNTSNFFQFM